MEIGSLLGLVLLVGMATCGDSDTQEGMNPTCGVVAMGCFKGELCKSERVDPICVAGHWACPAGSAGSDHCPTVDASPEVGDAAADANVDLECDARSEATCAADGRCHKVAGNTQDNYCSQQPGFPGTMYAGCTPSGRLNNTAITLATDPKTGRTLVFGSTEVPYGWTKLYQPLCPDPDAGQD